MPEAEDPLKEKDVIIIPDILANAGGVVVSYFEWIQNFSNDYWEKEQVYKKLEERILSAYKELIEFYKNNIQRSSALIQRDSAKSECVAPDLSLRDASYILAAKRIIKAEKLRGNL